LLSREIEKTVPFPLRECSLSLFFSNSRNSSRHALHCGTRGTPPVLVAMRAMEGGDTIGTGCEVPTPAHSVRLRRPVTWTVTYVVVCTAALMFVALMPFGRSEANGNGTGVVQAQVLTSNHRTPRGSSGYDAEVKDTESFAFIDGGDDDTLGTKDEEEEAPTMREKTKDALDEDALDASNEATSASKPKCVFHLYRHVSKTGGTTMRFVFDRQTVFGDFEFPLPYGFDEKRWNGLLARWREAAKQWRSGNRKAPPKTLVELRGNWPSNWGAENFEKVLGDLDELRQEFGGGEGDDDDVGANSQNGGDTIESKTCSVSTSLLFREPKKQYQSFWRYYIEKKQADDLKTQEVNKKWPDIDGTAFWGKGFKEWAKNVPSMQIRELLGNKCTSQMRQPGYDAAWNSDLQQYIQTGLHTFDTKNCPYTIDETDYGRFLALLKRISVVGVTEKFDAFLLAVAEKVGLARLEYVKSNVRSVSETAKETATGGATSSETSEEEGVLEQVASFDIKAHGVVSQMQDDNEANAEGGRTEFQKRVKEYTDKTSVSKAGVTFVGGFPAPSPFVWVKSSDLKGSSDDLITPQSWTDTSGGGQAIAYIVMDEVSLVSRAKASAKGVGCVKGCTFDYKE
jgi:hypothetical protein